MRSSVSDGDTLHHQSETGKVRVRICGIDAPERSQPGYGQATGVLSNMIEGKTVLLTGLRVSRDFPTTKKAADISYGLFFSIC
jgi:endonuclease YncB( thermonuclease family)